MGEGAADGLGAGAGAGGSGWGLWDGQFPALNGLLNLQALAEIYNPLPSTFFHPLPSKLPDEVAVANGGQRHDGPSGSAYFSCIISAKIYINICIILVQNAISESSFKP